MRPQDALNELLARLSASKDAAVLINEEELKSWPVEVVKAMKQHKLLVKARPTSSVVCPGCEEQCVMPVHTLAGAGSTLRAFVVCDKRDDINRVDVTLDRVEQWQCSGAALADLLAGQLDLRRSDTSGESVGRWEIGVLKGAKGSSHLVMLFEGSLTLNVAGHKVELNEVFSIENKKIQVDKRALMRLVDRPIAGAGDQESAAQRRARLEKLIEAEKKKGNKAFLKSIAEYEGISITRLKQIIQAEPSAEKRKFKRSAF